MERVLVIDDDEGIRQLMRFILEAEGYSVADAEGAPEGLQALEGDAPDLVLLDLSMPGMDGWKFLDELRQRGLRERTRVIIVSARADKASTERGHREGALGYITKPFSMEVLVDGVKAALAVSPEELASRSQRLDDLARTLNFLDTLLS